MGKPFIDRLSALPFWKRKAQKQPTKAAPPVDPVRPSRATGIHPLLPQAVAMHQAGDLKAAAKTYATILRDEPGHFDAGHLLGVIALQEGRLKEAQQQIAKALQSKPDDQSALSNLTAAYLRDGNLKEAAESGKRAAWSLPLSVDALLNFALVLNQLGRFGEAIDPLMAATRLNPGSTIVWKLLGSCQLKMADAQGAVTSFEQATAIAPHDAEGWANLSSALTGAGQPGRAMECANRAASLSADSSGTLAAQASALLELGKVEESIETFRRAVCAGNPSVPTLCGLARALITSGRSEEVADCLSRAVEIEPQNSFVRMLLAVSLLKPVYRDEQEIRASRIVFEKALTELAAWTDSFGEDGIYAGVGAFQPFFIAYQPLNNKDLLRKYGQICVRWMKTLPQVAPHPAAGLRPGSNRTRLGFVSAHVKNHSVWNAILKGWVHQLNAAKFELFLFKLDSVHDQETLAAKDRVEHFEDAPRGLTEWADCIRRSQLDAIIYDEIGMNALTLQLAALRLAPIQAATWGHPETTGLETIDYYISGECIEPAGAEQNYSEQLVRLPNLGVFVEPLEPQATEPNLDELGLPCDEPLLLCPGPPFKYSPLHDWVWVEIAKGLRDGAHGGRLVFFTTGLGAMHVQFASRLRGAFSEAGVDFDSHVCVIKFQTRASYFGLMHKASMMLDTLDFSGFNTALQSIECGLPYVAFEGQFMRGRLASGILRRIGLDELVAPSYEEFANLAIDLAQDPQGLGSIRDKIVSNREMAFRDELAVRGLEDFILSKVRKG